MLPRSVTLVATLLASAGVLGSPAPVPTPAPRLEDAAAKRATSCTFSGSDGYSLASVSKASCSTIVLSALAVPSGVTLNLEKLNDDTTVRYTQSSNLFPS
jgi:polygalacturonase